MELFDAVNFVGDMIPVLEKYPTSVKVFAALSAICALMAVLLALFLGPVPLKADQPKAAEKPAERLEAVVKNKGKAKKNSTTSTPMKQENVNGKNEININKGTNSGIIGGSNNTVTNITNVGIQPRVLGANELTPILAQYPDRNVPIHFKAFNGADAEMNNFKRQIINWLSQNGYTNIHSDWLLHYGQGEPAGINVVPSTSGGICFEIPHQ